MTEADHPWREKYLEKHGKEKMSRRVRFNPNYLEIPAPDFSTVDEYDVAPLPKSSENQTWSSLKKVRIPCMNESRESGAISVNGGKIVFSLEGRKEAAWSVGLSDVIHLAVVPNVDDSNICTLKLSLKNRERHVFSRIPAACHAFDVIIDDAALLGYVLVLDQLRAQGDAPIAADVEETPRKKQAPLLSKLITKTTHRFVNDKFNLDLSYITKRIIVMAFPAAGVKGAALNNIKDVKRFFDERHPHSYMVYNLNVDPEYTYEDNRFDGRVRKMGFADHGPPPLILLVSICHDIAAYLRQSPLNVIAVHCKAGKGRSGTIACAWMLHSRLFESADSAINYFSRMRMVEGPGISLPSQIRYVHYMETIGNHGLPPERTATLHALEFEPVLLKKGSLFVSIQSSNSDTNLIEIPGSAKKVALDEPIPMYHDARVDFMIDGGKTLICTAFFNVRMLTSTTLTLTRDDFDGAREYKSFKLLPDNFVAKLIMKFDEEEEERFLEENTKVDDANTKDASQKASSNKGTVKAVPERQKPKIPRHPTGWINRAWRSELKDGQSDQQAPDGEAGAEDGGNREAEGGEAVDDSEDEENVGDEAGVGQQELDDDPEMRTRQDKTIPVNRVAASAVQ